MTIEGIVCQRGTTLDLFHPSYFKSADELITFITNQRVYFYGWHNVEHSPTTLVVDTKKIIRFDPVSETSPISGKRYYVKNTVTGKFTIASYIDENKVKHDDGFIPKFDPGITYYERAIPLSADKFIMTSRSIFLQLDIDSDWVVDDPEIPPEQGWTTDTVKVDMWNLRIRFLHGRDEYTPKYYSVDQSSEIVAKIEEGNPDLELCKSSTSFSTHESVFFINGLCCYPTRYLDSEYGDAVKLANGRSYLRNQKDRTRGAVIVDFSKLADVEFVKISSCRGTIDSFQLPSVYDPDKCSFLLVVDGRLFLPDEFLVLSKGLVMFDSSKYKDIYALDRLCCSNAFIGVSVKSASDAEGIDEVTRYFPMTRNLVAGRTDLYNNDNSFVIVIKKKGLKVIKHRPLRGPDEGQFLKEPVTGEQIHHITFNSSAAGLLFDMTTRSVTDYTEETNDQDFYVKGVDIKYVVTDDDYPLSSKTYYKRVLDGSAASYVKTMASDFDYVDGRYKFKEGIDYFESRPLPQRWSTKMLYLKHNTPLERWGNPNNVMSASASMHDNKTVRGDAQVIWPRYTMLDFIFEG